MLHIKKQFRVLFCIVLLSGSTFAQPDLSELKVGLVISEGSKNLSTNKNSYQEYIQTWELYLINNRVKYHVFSDNDLNNNKFSSHDILIMPSVIFISDEAFQNIRQFIASGRGVLISELFGTYDAFGKRRSEDLLRDIAGFEVERLSDKPVPYVKHTLMASNPLADGLVSATYFNLTGNTVVFKAVKRNATVVNAGTYPDFEEKLFATEKEATGLVLSRFGLGKVVWMGFSPERIRFPVKGFSSADILKNSLIYLANFPSIVLNRLPGNYSAAMIPITNLKNPDSFKGSVADYLLEKGILVDHFIEHKMISLYNGKIGDLSLTGNLNLLLKEDEDKAEVIESGLKQLVSLNSIYKRSSRAGLKTIRENNLYSQLTSAAFLVSENNITINNTLKGSTSFVTSTGLFGKVSSVDRVIYINQIKHQLELIAAHSAIMLFSLYDANEISVGQIDLGMVSEIIEYAEKKKIWLTTLGQVTDWIESLQSLDYKFDFRKDRIVLDIKNNSEKDIEGVSFKIILPYYFLSLSASGLQNTAIQNSEKKGEFVLNLPLIKAGSDNKLELVPGR